MVFVDKPVVLDLHFAPEPQARARSGCWITVKVYVRCLPLLVTRETDATVGAFLGLTVAIVFVCDGGELFNGIEMKVRSVDNSQISKYYGAATKNDQRWFPDCIRDAEGEVKFPTPKVMGSWKRRAKGRWGWLGLCLTC